jgi:hypothetical protein
VGDAGVETSLFSPMAVGVEEAATQLRQTLSIQAEHFLFCFVGRLNKDKGLADIYASEKNYVSTDGGYKSAGRNMVGETHELYAPANYSSSGLTNPDVTVVTRTGETVNKPIRTGSLTLDDIKYLESQGYTGIANNIGDVVSASENVVWDPNILKSATKNVGFFDITNPNIYKSVLPYIIGTGAAGTLLNSNEQTVSPSYQEDVPGFKTGGSIELELTDKEIEEYKRQGYIVEEY